MERPYVLLHMLQSLDGKAIGNFLDNEHATQALDLYYQLEEKYQMKCFACGKITFKELLGHPFYHNLKDF